jgi:predicted DNA-binding transcriptional regulator AlpA
MIPTKQTQTTPRNSRLIPAEDFRAALGGMSRTTEYRLVKSGELPPAIKIGGKCFRTETEATELIAQKRQEADARQAETVDKQDNTEPQN